MTEQQRDRIRDAANMERVTVQEFCYDALCEKAARVIEERYNKDINT